MVDISVLDMISQQSLHKDMDEAPTPEEIYSAIKSLKLGKSAGLDSLAAEFYQRGGDTLQRKLSRSSYTFEIQKLYQRT